MLPGTSISITMEPGQRVEIISLPARKINRGLQMRLKYTFSYFIPLRSEEHTSELQSHLNLVCRLLLEKKKSSLFVQECAEQEQNSARRGKQYITAVRSIPLS